MNDPIPGRPNMPGYGISEAPPDAPPWSTIVETIAASRNYWVSSTRPDGRPHAAPVWGVVVDGVLCFSTGGTSVKGRNLAARSDVFVHLESGDDVVMLEGAVEPITDPAALAAFVEAYDVKYQVRPEPGGDDPIYAVRPRVAYTWEERDFPNTATRWRFEA